MKAATKRRKQLETVDEWLAKARPVIETRVVAEGWSAEFSLLIAMEQLVVYLKMLEQSEHQPPNPQNK